MRIFVISDDKEKLSFMEECQIMKVEEGKN